MTPHRTLEPSFHNTWRADVGAPNAPNVLAENGATVVAAVCKAVVPGTAVAAAGVAMPRSCT